MYLRLPDRNFYIIPELFRTHLGRFPTQFPSFSGVPLVAKLGNPEQVFLRRLGLSPGDVQVLRVGQALLENRIVTWPLFFRIGSKHALELLQSCSPPETWSSKLDIQNFLLFDPKLLFIFRT